MNMRKQKYYMMNLMAWRYWFIRFHDTAAPALNLAAVEEAKVEYVCTRTKDGVVVATFDTLADAHALAERHIKQRKAKLAVVNSATGEILSFASEEVGA